MGLTGITVQDTFVMFILNISEDALNSFTHHICCRHFPDD